jgi:hypothetical protein
MLPFSVFASTGVNAVPYRINSPPIEEDYEAINAPE